MKCDKCNSEWNAGSSVSKMTKCPFCGADLAPAAKGGTVTDLNTAVKRIIEMNGEDILRNKGRFTAMLGDIAPKLVTEKKFFDIALSENVGGLFLDKSISHEECLTRVRNKLSVILNDSAVDAVTGSITAALGWENTPAAAPAETAPAPKAAKKTDEDQKPKTPETAVVKKADAEQKHKPPAPTKHPKTPVPPKQQVTNTENVTVSSNTISVRKNVIAIVICVVVVVFICIAVVLPKVIDQMKLRSLELIAQEESPIFDVPDTSTEHRDVVKCGKKLRASSYKKTQSLMFKVEYKGREGYMYASDLVTDDPDKLGKISFYSDELKQWQSESTVQQPQDKPVYRIAWGDYSGKLLYLSPNGKGQHRFESSVTVDVYAESEGWYYVELDYDEKHYCGWVKSSSVLLK